MALPFQISRIRGSSVTVATMVASRFSSCGRADKGFGIGSGATATAIRSWLSLMASSVPSRPSYFLVTLFRSMYRPSASSPMATDTPPAPKSLQRLIMRQASSRRNRRCSLRSMGALPFCTSAPQCLQTVQLVGLGGTGSAADAVTAGAAAQQHDDVTRGRATRGAHGWPGWRPRRRRSPCAWPHSRDGRVRPT